MREATAATDASPNDRCLFCGKKGHRSTSDIHALELAEGGLKASQDQLTAALANIAKDETLSAEQKRTWASRINGFFAKMEAGKHNASAL